VQIIKYTRTKALEKYKLNKYRYILPLKYTLSLSIANRELDTMSFCHLFIEQKDKQINPEIPW
jgi:hypothetical protein